MTTGRRPVVVGVENSAAGLLAVGWAADEAVRHRLPLRLVHASEWPAEPAEAEAAYRAARHDGRLHTAHAFDWAADTYHEAGARVTVPRLSWSERRRAADDALLEKAAAVATTGRTGLEVSVATVEGRPVDVLRGEAPGSSMLVLGSRRLSALTELLTTGSIAIPVSAHAPCPVAVVRGPEPATGVPPTVVVGVDGSAGSEPAVGYAFQTASLRGASLRAVQVRPPTPNMVAAFGSESEVEEGLIRLGETLAGWSEKYPDVPVERITILGHRVRGLADAAQDALCLVVGARGVGGFRGMLLGSVTHGLIHHAPGPLVIVPRQGEDTR
ncbi:universal stress protein [Embleya scabrispora]|uniref:universal stress protein n=1 Tax=Embleya scabrispora TaxID=159449 RepID=UPI00035C9F40|nr:universal stress protein [Embleya scabrispora]MYS86001.1 universal stress protein [Streptomyces sp. SID5474]